MRLQKTDLIELYTNLATTLGVKVTEDGYLTKSGRTITGKQKSLVMPTDEHIKTMTDLEDGKPIITKVLFNPLNESAIGGDSTTLSKVKILMSSNIEIIVRSAIELLISLGTNAAVQSKTPHVIKEFLTSLGTIKGSERTKPLDAKSSNKFNKLLDTFTGTKKPFEYIIKKSAMVDGVKYTRLLTMKSKLYNALKAAKKAKNYTINEVKLSKKDVDVFILLLEYTLPTLKDGEGKVTTTSNDTTAPTFLAHLDMYLTITNKPLDVIKRLKDIDTEIYDTGYIKHTVAFSDFENVSKYKHILVTIPSEQTTNAAVLTAPTQQPTPVVPTVPPVNIPAVQNTQTPVASTIPVTQPTPPTTTPADTTDDYTLKLANKLLGGYGTNYLAPKESL